MTGTIDPWEAATNDDLDSIISFIDSGGDVNCRDGNNNTPLHWACQDSHFDIVGVLMSRGAEVDPVNNFQSTPLHYSAREGNLDIVTGLINFGANLEARNKDNLSPLHVAAGMGHADVTKVLIDSGADKEAVDNALYTPLWRASYYGHVATVKILLAAGANRNALNKKGKRPGQVIAPSVEKEVQNEIRALLNVEKHTPSTTKPSDTGSISPRSPPLQSKSIAFSEVPAARSNSGSDNSDESEVSLLRIAIANHEDEARMMQKRIRKMDTTAAVSTTTILEQEAIIKAEKANVEQLKKDAAQKDKDFAEISDQLASAKKELDTVNKEIAALKSKNEPQMTATSLAEIELLRSQLAAKESEVVALTAKVNSLQAELNHASKKLHMLANLEDDYKAKNAEVEALTWQLSKKSELANRSEEMQRITQTLEAKEKELWEMSERLRKVEDSDSKLKAELHETKQKLEEANAIIDKNDSDLKAYENQNKAIEPIANEPTAAELERELLHDLKSSNRNIGNDDGPVKDPLEHNDSHEAVRTECKCSIM